MSMQWNDNDVADDDEHLHTKSSRREFFSKIARVAATAPILLGSAPRVASSAINDVVTNEPTRIELSVDTEYLIRVLEYFDGDMRKVLGALVRSPQTTVEILPPPPANRGIYKDSKKNMSPEDAILRALYSYNAPEDYAAQASWLKVDEPDRGWVAALTKKRYTIQLPSLGSSDDVGGSMNVDGGEEGTSVEVVIQPTAISLSNLEAGVGLGVLSYPAAYTYYNYERNREEQEKKAKKAKAAAKKKAAKAKAAGASKKGSTKKKGTSKKEKAAVGKVESEEVTKKKKKQQQRQPPAMKGQERKKEGEYVGDNNAPMPTKKATTAVVTKPVTNTDRVASEMIDSQRENFIAAKAVVAKSSTNSDRVATEMIDSQRENFIAAKAVVAKSSTNSDRVATEMIDSQRENFIAATAEAEDSKQWWEKPQPEIEPDRIVNELEQLVAAAAAAAADAAADESAKPSVSYQSTATSGGYLDNLSQGSSRLDGTTTTPPLSRPAGATGYLDDASLDFSESAQQQQSDLAGSGGDDAEGSDAGGGGGTSLRSLVDNGTPKRGPPNNYLDSL